MKQKEKDVKADGEILVKTNRLVSASVEEFEMDERHFDDVKRQEPKNLKENQTTM